MNKEYAEKVEVLLRLLPIVMDEKVFAVHGGSAINLFVRDLPRYSVDIDLTYIPLEGREESLEHINNHLMSIVDKAKRAFHGMHIVPKLNTSKLLCEYQGKQVKVEVNQTKRGIIGGIAEAYHQLILSEMANEALIRLPESMKDTLKAFGEASHYDCRIAYVD